MVVTFISVQLLLNDQVQIYISKMTMRWLRDNDERCSLSSIPEAIIRDVVFAFLREEEAFRARRTCLLFSKVYFCQSYERISNNLTSLKRMFAMLSKGYLYPKIKLIHLHRWDDARSWPLPLLKRLPGLKELRVTISQFFTIEELPTSLALLQVMAFFSTKSTL